MHVYINPSPFILCVCGRWSPLSMSNNMAKIADARKTVEQLKLEVNIERMMVSISVTPFNTLSKTKVNIYQ